ncbi:MAG: hypothetical protein ABIJ26_02340 [Candidatus Margulisiibacteriota bacterium]
MKKFVIALLCAGVVAGIATITLAVDTPVIMNDAKILSYGVATIAPGQVEVTIPDPNLHASGYTAIFLGAYPGTGQAMMPVASIYVSEIRAVGYSDDHIKVKRVGRDTSREITFSYLAIGR